MMAVLDNKAENVSVSVQTLPVMQEGTDIFVVLELGFIGI